MVPPPNPVPSHSFPPKFSLPPRNTGQSQASPEDEVSLLGRHSCLEALPPGFLISSFNFVYLLQETLFSPPDFIHYVNKVLFRSIFSFFYKWEFLNCFYSLSFFKLSVLLFRLKTFYTINSEGAVPALKRLDLKLKNNFA